MWSLLKVSPTGMREEKETRDKKMSQESLKLGKQDPLGLK